MRTIPLGFLSYQGGLSRSGQNCLCFYVWTFPSYILIDDLHGISQSFTNVIAFKT